MILRGCVGALPNEALTILERMTQAGATLDALVAVAAAEAPPTRVVVPPSLRHVPWTSVRDPHLCARLREEPSDVVVTLGDPREVVALELGDEVWGLLCDGRWVVDPLATVLEALAFGRRFLHVQVVALKQGAIMAELLPVVSQSWPRISTARPWAAVRLLVEECAEALRRAMVMPDRTGASVRWPDPARSLALGDHLRAGATIATAGLNALVDRHLVRDKWAIGIVDGPIEDLLAEDLPAPRWFPSPTKAFAADPFAVPTKSGWRIFCEVFDGRREKGYIAGGTEEEYESGHYPAVLEDRHHLSYPFVFTHEGRTFAVPESNRAREVTLYEIDPSGEWRRLRTLLRGQAVCDPTVFFHDGLFWLLGTMADDEENGRLHAWFATDLEGEWLPHAANPVKCCAFSSRPAGTPFRKDGALYRPAQDCSRTYGGRIALNRVDSLTPTTFRETLVRFLDPPPGPFRRGLHTLSAAGGQTFVDGKRRVFAPRF